MPTPDEKDLQILFELLPALSQQLRGSMSNLYQSLLLIATPEEREKNPELDRNAAILLRNYYQVLRLLGNLSFSPELAANDAFPLQNGDIAALCATVCEKAESLFAMNGVRLVFDTKTDSHCTAFHPALLERLLLNLLSNALRASDRGDTVTLRLRVGPSDVRIAVCDGGKGIAEEKLETAFERYLHPDLLDPELHGFGMGLALCRRIALGMGGRLMAESSPDTGTTVTLSLPDRCVSKDTVQAPQVDYTGGFNHFLVEFSDVLPPDAFTVRNLD